VGQSADGKPDGKAEWSWQTERVELCFPWPGNA